MASTVKVFTFNDFSENTLVVHCTQSKQAFIIDPGCYSRQERAQLQQYIAAEGLQPVAVLNTHAHIDHVLGNAWVMRQFNLPMHLHPRDLSTLRAIPAYAPNYGFSDYEPVEPSFELTEGQTLTLGSVEFQVIYVPGHSPGHVAFYNKAENYIVSGDVLFDGAVGRWDLPGGDFGQLEQSIKTQLYILPGETLVYPGHGPTTTIGKEKLSNPFVKG